MNKIIVPKLVYHGSPKRYLKLLPYTSSLLAGKEVVFAGDLWFAIACVQRWDDTEIITGTSDGKPFIREKHAGIFDHIYSIGGYVHTCKGTNFHTDDRLTDYEYISTKPVIPIKTEYIKDPLLKLDKLGVKIIYAKKKVSVINLL